MWIISFQRVPSYWLVGGASYVIGRKDTDIVILDDASVSRSHVTLQIDHSTMPHSMSITDTSRYGTSVHVHGAAPHPLQQSTFRVPADVKELRLVIGTHGLEFQLQWLQRKVALGTIADEVNSKLQHHLLPRCGYGVVPEVTDCDVFASSEIDATQGIMTSLCAGKPIVTPAFFDAIVNQRHNCKVPLPDPNLLSFVPPVNSDVWGPFFPEKAAAAGGPDASMSLRTLFMVRNERLFLLSDVTFVCPQSILYDEVLSFVPLAQGRVLQDTLLMAKDDRQKHMESFLARHTQPRHVVLYTRLAEFLDETTIAHLQSKGIILVEYGELLRSIVEGRRLLLASSTHNTSVECLTVSDRPSTALTAATTDQSTGRKTNRLLFPVEGEEQSPKAKAARVEGFEEASRWRSRDVLQSYASNCLSIGNQAGPELPPNSADDEDMIMHHSLRFPAFPCFRQYAEGSSKRGNSGKPFQKQQLLPAPAAYAAYESVATSNGVAMLIGRVAPIDADDVVDMRVDDVRPLQDTMNLFDVAEQNRASKKRANAANRRQSKPVQRAATSAVAVRHYVVADDVPPSPPPPRAQPKPTGGPVNVFDLDALF